MTQHSTVHLSTFNNDWYSPGRSAAWRVAWYVANRAFLHTSVPWPYGVKRAVLRAFGAEVGEGVVIKPRVNVKYPWNLSIGDHAWIGEGAWIDSLARVTVGANACLSQGVLIETGNHDWTRATFDLVLKDVVVEEGAWAAVRSLLLPGSQLARNCVLGAGGVLAGCTEPDGVYAGNPARRVKERRIGVAA